jgi:hypothetical protein
MPLLQPGAPLYVGTALSMLPVPAGVEPGTFGLFGYYVHCAANCGPMQTPVARVAVAAYVRR